MRMITIGYPLPNANVDNHSVLNAPSLTDYEAVFVDPEGVTGAVQELLAGERDFTAHDGRPVINGASTAASVSAADQLHRRVEEAERFLDSGRHGSYPRPPECNDLGGHRVRGLR